MIPSKPIVEPTFTIETDRHDATIRRFYMEGDRNNMFMLKSTDKTITVWLQLVSENLRKREIGTITKSTRTMFMRRDRKKHLFIKTNSYGFCHHILRYQTTFDTISLSDETQNWKIPVKFILDNGDFLNFKNAGGFELQIFVSLEQLQQFEVKLEEGRRI